MNDAALFDATVPVFRRYRRRIDALLTTLADEQESLLGRSLAPHAFSAAEHLDTALGFVPRTLLPVLGRDVPESDAVARDRSTLLAASRNVEGLLRPLTVEAFDGAASRRVRHTAGTAELDQDATTYVTVFALPNFFFHLCTAFAILRHAGVDIGKADFDAQHVYDAGFHF